MYIRLPEETKWTRINYKTFSQWEHAHRIKYEIREEAPRSPAQKDVIETAGTLRHLTCAKSQLEVVLRNHQTTLAKSTAIDMVNLTIQIRNATQQVIDQVRLEHSERRALDTKRRKKSV